MCINEGQYPVIAAALSGEAWYTWISPHLFDTKPACDPLIPSDMIQVETPDSSSGDRHRLIIGHNVSYDRARCMEQYKRAPASKTRFLDTMSMHIAVSGKTNSLEL